MLERIGNFLVEVTDSRRGRILFVLASAFLAGLLEYVVHLTISYYVKSPSLALAIDSVTIALLIAAIAGVEVEAVHHRRRKVIDDIRVVRELNHHVRNALQIIQYASRLPEQRQQVVIIDESVARIDATLKELFPQM